MPDVIAYYETEFLYQENMVKILNIRREILSSLTLGKSSKSLKCLMENADILKNTSDELRDTLISLSARNTTAIMKGESI